MRMDNRDYMKAFGEWRCYIIYNSPLSNIINIVVCLL